MTFSDSRNASKSVDRGRAKGGKAMQDRNKPRPSELWDVEASLARSRAMLTELYGDSWRAQDPADEEAS